MKGLEHIEKIREYCDYLERHLNNVQTSWKTLQEKCDDMQFIYDDYVYWSIDELVKNHDLSKFTAAEFTQYQGNFYPTKKQEGSLVAKEAFAQAWANHLRHNPHHHENWVRKPYYNPYEAEMHCVCMVIDWMAMGLEFGDTAESYYKRNKDTIDLPLWAVKLIREIFDRTRA